jgi:ADP-heptose:LPS heptosyltransferase
MKVLILRFSSIGDIVLTTPVIRCLKEQVAGVEIHYATKSAFKGIVSNNLYIDKVHTLEHSTTVLIQELKNEKFDLIIDLHKNLRTKKIIWSLGVKSVSFNKLNIRKWLFVNWKFKTMPDKHIVDRYMETLIPLGVHNDDKGLDYFIPEKDVVALTNLPAAFQTGNYVAIAIGAQHATKRLPLEKLKELVQKISLPILLLGGKDDASMGEKLIASCYESLHILNTCGQYNLNQSASLVQQAAYLYTHDTGLMHIAAAFKKRIVSIWGNTVPEFGMYPYKTEYVAWQVENLSCRPCSKIGYNACPKKHFKCMKEQTLPVQEIESLWKK